MKGKTAGILFVLISLVVAALLITKSITPLIGGCIFAVALALLGIVSGGFRR